VPLRPGGRFAGGLWRLPSFRLLLLATLASAAGTWLAGVALVLDVYDRTGSASWVGVLLVAEFVPLVVVGLAAGPLLDRVDRRRLLVGSDLLRAAVFAAMPFTTSALQIVLLALVAGAATSVFRPVLLAGLPNVVSDEQLPQANGLLLAAENAMVAVGPVLGGVLVAWGGVDAAYWLNAASFAVSATLLVRVGGALGAGGGEREGHWREVVAGLALLRSSRPLLAVVAAWGLVMLGFGIVNVSEVVLAKETLDAGDAGYGLMLTAVGVGLLCGSLWAASAIDRAGLRAAYTGALTLLAAGTAITAAAPSLWVAVPALLLAGVGNGLALVGNTTIVQRGVADALRGRAFTLVMSATFAALGAGMIAAGPLTDEVGPRTAWAAAASLMLAATVVAAALTRGLARSGVPSASRQHV
jgi:MFS family permease